MRKDLLARLASRSYAWLDSEPHNGNAVKSSTASVARLNARPAPHSQSGGAGVAHLDIESKRGALLYAPESALKRAVAPLAVLLHGAGGNAEHGLGILNAYADEAKLILLAPESR